MPYYEPGLDPVSYGTDAGVIYDRVPKGEVEVRRASAGHRRTAIMWAT